MAAYDQAIRQFLSVNAACAQSVNHHGDAVALLNAELGGADDAGFAFRECGDDGENWELVNHSGRAPRWWVGAVEFAGADNEIGDRLADRVAPFFVGDLRAHLEQGFVEAEPERIDE